MVIGGVPVTITPTNIHWIAGMKVDFDGAPNAYAPRGTPALDVLANAGHPGNWYGLACDENGEPFVQGPHDPFPGFYISQTALVDRAKHHNNPARYVDATKVPYIAVPKVLLKYGVRIGDVCHVTHLPSGQARAALVADVGGNSHIGEGSAALCAALGLPYGRYGGVDAGVAVSIFLGTSSGWPRTNESIAAQVLEILNQLGGE